MRSWVSRDLQRLPHSPSQSCLHLVSAPACSTPLQHCRLLPVVTSEGALQCDATLCISFLQLSLCVLATVSSATLKGCSSSQMKLKGQTNAAYTQRHPAVTCGRTVEPLLQLSQLLAGEAHRADTCRMSVHCAVSDCNTVCTPHE